MRVNQPIVRHAYLEEYEVAATIAAQCYQQFQNQIAPGLWPVMENWVIETTNLKNGGELLIASSSQCIVGSAVYYPPSSQNNSFFPSGSSYIDALSVIPDERRNGIARAILKACNELAKSDKSDQFCASISSLMTEAIGLFLDYGFQRRSKFQRLYGVEYNLYTNETL